MIELTILDYLQMNIDIPVYLETPLNPPDEYIIVEKTGGGQINRLNQAMVAIQSIVKRTDAENGSLLRAMKLNATVKSLMEDIIYSANIYRCELNSDYNFTNPETGQYRYQAVFNLFYND